MILFDSLERLLCRPGKREMLLAILAQLNRLEIRMSALDDATADLSTAVSEIASVITAPVEALQAKLDEALAKLAEAQSNDVTDAEEISRLQSEVADLLTDASENVSVISEQTAKLRSFGTTPTEPAEPEVPADPENPVTEF